MECKLQSRRRVGGNAWHAGQLPRARQQCAAFVPPNRVPAHAPWSALTMRGSRTSTTSLPSPVGTAGWRSLTRQSGPRLSPCAGQWKAHAATYLVLQATLTTTHMPTPPHTLCRPLAPSCPLPLQPKAQTAPLSPRHSVWKYPAASATQRSGSGTSAGSPTSMSSRSCPLRSREGRGWVGAAAQLESAARAASMPACRLAGHSPKGFTQDAAQPHAATSRRTIRK